MSSKAKQMEDCSHEEWEYLEENCTFLQECKNCGLCTERQNFYVDDTRYCNYDNYIEDNILPIQRTEKFKHKNQSKYFKKRKIKTETQYILNLLESHCSPPVVNRIADLYLDLKSEFPTVKFQKGLIVACIFQIIGREMYIPSPVEVKKLLKVKQGEITSAYKIMKEYCIMRNIDNTYEENKKQQILDNKTTVDQYIEKICKEKGVDSTVLEKSMEFCKILNDLDKIFPSFNELTARAIVDYVDHIYRQNNLKNMFSDSHLKSKPYQNRLYKINIIIKTVLEIFRKEIPEGLLSRFDLDYKLFLRCLEYLKTFDSRSIRILLKKRNRDYKIRYENIGKLREKYKNDKSIHNEETLKYETVRDVIIDLIHRGWDDEKILEADIERMQRQKAVERYKEMTEEEKSLEIDELVKTFIQKEISKKFLGLDEA